MIEDPTLRIETNRLTLRVFSPADLNIYHATVYGDAEVMRFLPGGVPRPLQGTESVLHWTIQQFARFGFTMWSVWDKETGTFIGHCGVIPLQDSGEFELAYALGKAYWGQGYAHEAAHASIRHCFETSELKKIYAMAFPENRNSQRVMQKLGMQYEGVTDRYHNAQLILYSLAQAAFVPGDAHYRLIREVSA